MLASKLKNAFLNLARRDVPTEETQPSFPVTELTEKQVATLQNSLGYVFKKKGLLIQSLTHSSYYLHTGNQLQSNQRLEFLGDSVIQLALTEELYKEYPKEREGKLTSLRSSFARGDTMADIARRLGLHQYIILREKERKAGIAEQDSSLGDAFEAIIGAIFLDSDWATARKVTLKLYGKLVPQTEQEERIANPKGKLQEMIQPLHGNDAIRYETTSEQGEPHNRFFEITVFCNDKAIGVGTGKTKKEAAEKAALQGLAAMEESK